MDPELRDEARAVLAECGLDLSTAVEMFLRAVVRDEGLPFRVGRRPRCEYAWVRLDEGDEREETR